MPVAAVVAVAVAGGEGGDVGAVGGDGERAVARTRGTWRRWGRPSGVGTRSRTRRPDWAGL